MTNYFLSLNIFRMSWATCYAGSNNIYYSFPPLMNDGRNFASWQPGAVLNNELKKSANIKTNWEYRQYLTENADNIIKINQTQSCNNCGCCPYLESNLNNNNNNDPYLYNTDCYVKNNNCQPIGYENSDLKDLYLSREQLSAMKSENITFKLS